MNSSTDNNELILFKPESSQNEFQILFDGEQETVWASEQPIAQIFNRDRIVIGRHIRNIFKDEELDRISVSAKFAHTAEDGKTYQVQHFNLDLIISVGYRVKSKIATEFRKWGTAKIKECLIKGYTVIQSRLSAQKDRIFHLENTIDEIRQESFEQQQRETDRLLSIINIYSKSFELLNKFDSGGLSKDNLNDEFIYTINYEEVKSAIEKLKSELILKGEATELFGNEKDSSFQGILRSISQ